MRPQPSRKQARARLGRLVAAACGLLACGGVDAGCAADPEARPPVRTAPVAEVAPGHVLVELGPGRRLSDFAVAAVAAIQGALGLLPTGQAERLYRIGGVELELVRPMFEPADCGPGEGPIYFFTSREPLDGRTAAEATAATYRLVDAVSRDPGVRRAEPDFVRRIAGFPNDKLYGKQWSLPLIKASEAWATTVGAESVVVAVLDTGILPEHPDLAGRLEPGYDFVSEPLSADDGDPLRDGDPTDTGTRETSRLHGTHVAGIIGAASNNRIGIAGLDHRCRILPVRVLGVRGGDGIDTDIADAMRWAVGITVGKIPPAPRPAQILNMSFGGPTISFTLQRSLDAVLAQGALVIAAAGNGGADAMTYSPGALDGVINVGASGRMGERADYSNYGPRVDLLAPGGSADAQPDGEPDGILSTYRDDSLGDPLTAPYDYEVLAGTSQAAPHVAAGAALVRALRPQIRQSTFASLLRASADERARCDLSEYGGCGAGLLDLAKLVRLATLQAACGCSGDDYCLEDKVCRRPENPHASVFDRNEIRGGWCTLAPRRAAASSGLFPSVGLGLLLVARRRRKRSA